MRGLCYRAVFTAMICIMLPALSASGQSGYGLLVAVDQYSFITAERDRLRGASTDLELTRRMLGVFGFKNLIALRNSQARSADILREMGRIETKAQRGDQAVFYFSGRGSVAPDPRNNNDPRNMEPTLVPFDGVRETPRNDMRIRRVEEWATRLERKGVTVTVILDTCFVGDARKSGEFRPWRDVPRSVVRQGVPREQIYRGPGLCLTATTARGRSYEWELTFGRWSGAFTYELICAAGKRFPERPTWGEMVEDVRRFFLSKARDYMPGQIPSPARADLAYDLRDRAIFTPEHAPAEPTTAPTPQQQQEFKQVLDERKEMDRNLRVSLDVLDVSDQERKRILDELYMPLKTYLADNLQGVMLVAPGAARPDRVIQIMDYSRGRLSAKLKGTEVEDVRLKTASGRDIAEVMQDGLADYVQRQAYVLKLYRMAETGQNLPGEWSVRTDRAEYAADVNNPRQSDSLVIQIESAVEGDLYILNQDPNGLVHLLWPAPAAPNNRVKIGATRWPESSGIRIRVLPPKGQTINRALLVVSSAPLPSLEPPAGTEWQDDDPAYSKAELAHLRALLEAIQNGQARWAIRTFTYDTVER